VVGVKSGGSSNDRIGWYLGAENNQRMVHDAQPGSFGETGRYAMFGVKSPIINNLGWLGQRIYVEPSETYTYSIHIKRPGTAYASGGGLVIRARGYDSNDNQLFNAYEVEFTDDDPSV